MKMSIQENKKVHSEDLCVRISLLQQLNTEKKQALWTAPIMPRSIKKVNT